jgi:hypothetical protein
MKAYIQSTPSGDPYNVNAFIANEGFTALGWETQKYISAEEVEDRDPESVFVGGVVNVRKRLELIGKPWMGVELEYPQELTSFLGRKVWSSTVGEILRTEHWNIFLKPKETKIFNGKVVRDYVDFAGLAHETEVWCSEPVSFVTEWRCFVRYGEILDIRRYKGAWDTKPDVSVIRNAIAAFISSPAAYALDFGITESGEMKLVEVNDGHSLGTYGIGAVSYAKFLSARWAEMTGTTDYLNF